jgi:hypothetical protein
MNTDNAPLFEILDSTLCDMRRSRILHKDQGFSLATLESYPTINNWDNFDLISSLLDSTLIFLLEQARPLCVIIETAPKHPSFASLKALNNTSRVLFFTNSTSNPSLYITISVNLYLITP